MVFPLANNDELEGTRPGWNIQFPRNIDEEVKLKFSVDDKRFLNLAKDPLQSVHATTHGFNKPRRIPNEKNKKKLFDNLRTFETIVSVYMINDLSHKQTHRKVYVKANHNQLTGCMVIAEGISIVDVEGGSKPIKRFRNLMLRRIY